MARVRVEHGDYPQADGVVGHRQQQQEIDCGMVAAEHHPGHQPRQRDVRRRGDAPAVGYFRKAVRPAVEYRREQKVDAHRAQDSAYRRHQGIDGLVGRVQRPAWQHRIGNLLCGYAKEEDHEDFIDEEMDRY